MPVNHVLLETIQLTQSAASVTFDNIPQTGYSSLKIVYSARSNRNDSADDVKLQFNGITTGYSNKRLYGYGTGITSDQAANVQGGFGAANTATEDTFGNTEIYIPNYTSSNQKSFSVDAVSERNNSVAVMALIAGLSNITNAITSVLLAPTNGTAFLQYSTFSLYGIAATGTTPAVGPKAQGGNIVANDGTYWYHAFLSSGTFTPTVALTADILQVAGGGGAGNGSAGAAGGGGAGGLLAYTSQSLTATSYTCTVGAGGAGATTTASVPGFNGVNSQFGSLTASAGGGGGGSSSVSGGAPGNGGSGGGGYYDGVSSRAGGTATPSGQGNSGGSSSASQGGAGGGGGAGAVGGNGTTVGGNGGAGINTYSSWATATSTGVSGYYAGGGAGGGYNVSGGTGGAGGGGNGCNATLATNTGGTANTGGGAGGGGNGNRPNGGSGIVIIRYTMA